MSLDPRPTSASDRALPFRRRPDLVVVEQREGGATVHAIKDPVALRYHRLREHEFFVLERLDGERSANALKDEYERRFAPETVDAATLHGFVQQLYASGLVEHVGPGEGERRWDEAERRRRADWWDGITNVLSIRFRGFDPEPLLRFLESRFGWLLSPAAIIGYLVLVAAAVVTIVGRWDDFVRQLPTVGEFFTPGNLAILASVVAGTKVLHELGHALVQRRFGGECHEMGLLLLVLVPCLYCDVSDAWMLRERWKRIAVAVAGIGVELVLAAACTLVWWTTSPGWIHSVCLNLMVASTVGTLFFNGNPLLRYDGYFVLSDVVGVPNLGSRSEGELGRVASAWCLGRDVPASEERGRFGLLLYALAARAYRWFVLVLIGWGLYHAAKPFDLSAFVVPLMLLVVGTMLVRSGVRAGRRVANPFWRRDVKPGRVAITAIIVGGLVAGVLLVPLPRTVRAPGLVRLAEAEAIYVRVPGTLQNAVPYGTPLDPGDPIAQLVDIELQLELVRLRGEKSLLETRIDNLEALQGRDGIEGNELPALRASLATATESLARRERDFRDLDIHATRAGTLLPPPEQPEVPGGKTDLPRWSGLPFDPENRGAFLDRGTLLGQVGDPGSLEVVALVDETDVVYTRAGQRATFVLGQRPGEVVEGEVRDVAEVAIDDVPPELVAWAELPRRVNESGQPVVVGTWFRVRIAVEAGALAGVRPRARGHATIHVAPQTLGGRLARWLRTVLRFES